MARACHTNCRVPIAAHQDARRRARRPSAARRQGSPRRHAARWATSCASERARRAGTVELALVEEGGVADGELLRGARPASAAPGALVEVTL